MSKQSKELRNSFKRLVDDIFDNFDEYEDEEKQKVQTELLNLEKLNDILEKYDKKTFFDRLRFLFGNATGKK